jgi:hypothetical protein
MQGNSSSQPKPPLSSFHGDEAGRLTNPEMVNPQTQDSAHESDQGSTCINPIESVRRENQNSTRNSSRVLDYAKQLAKRMIR